MALLLTQGREGLAAPVVEALRHLALAVPRHRRVKAMRVALPHPVHLTTVMVAAVVLEQSEEPLAPRSEELAGLVRHLRLLVLP